MSSGGKSAQNGTYILSSRLTDWATHSSFKVNLPALTGARFLAASSIVVYHYGLGPLAAISTSLAQCAQAGPTAVSFFYVLSGAVITWGCTGRDGASGRPRQVFWTQRARRILPAYLLALLLSAGPAALHVWHLHPGAPGLIRIVAGVGGSLLLVQALWPPLAEGFNTPGWSISCEAFFYALWPWLVRQLRTERAGLPWRRGLSLWGAGLILPALGVAALRANIVAGGTIATLTHDVSGAEMLARTLSYFPPIRLPEFALGIVIGHALRQTPPRVRSMPVDTLREALLAGALIICALALGSGVLSRVLGIPLADRIAIESGLLAPLFGLSVWQLARGRGGLQRILSSRPAVVLGEASYAMYILQEPVVVWSTALLKRSAPSVAANWTVVFWVYFVLLVLVSMLVVRSVERPARAVLARMTGLGVSRSEPPRAGR
ncbi:MAG: acyltransferase [Vicinamibacterales bacterium]